ncbi:Retrotransposon gag protein [Pyrenophora tritici-repentis]|nr:Retrotransposon gag protein [Pyrenophora tritici-repentis]
MSSPGDTDMTTNDSNQLLQSLLQRLEDMSTRMERLEAPSHELPQTPGHNTDATTDPTPTSETSNTSVPITPKPRHSLPHPPTFGGNKSQWRGWKLEMEGKIEEDAQAIGSLKAQLRYVYMRLDGAAKTNVTTYYEIQVKEESPNPFKLLDRLELLYGERNRRRRKPFRTSTLYARRTTRRLFPSIHGLRKRWPTLTQKAGLSIRRYPTYAMH